MKVDTNKFFLAKTGFKFIKVTRKNMRNSKKLVPNWSTDEGSRYTNCPYFIGQEKHYERDHHIVNVYNLESFLFDALQENKFKMTHRRYKIL